jgi:hypothetical protein
MKACHALVTKVLLIAISCMIMEVSMGGANETEAGDKLLSLGDFEKGDLSGCRISGNSPTVTSSPTRAGRYAMKTPLDRYKDKVS